MTEAATSNHPVPEITDRATWQERIDELRVKEKAHTRAGDALAAQRRQMPIVEVDSAATLIGANGPVALADAFDGRSQLIAYFHMWHTGRPAAEQCEGCTFFTTHINELSYLHSRDVGYGPLRQGVGCLGQFVLCRGGGRVACATVRVPIRVRREQGDHISLAASRRCFVR